MPTLFRALCDLTSTRKTQAQQRILDRQISGGQIMIANPLAEYHRPGGTGPPEPRESQVVQALCPLLPAKNNAIKGISFGRSTLARGLHSFSSSELVSTVN